MRECLKVTPCISSCSTAAGKVILFGEHAVVYGHPAIALPFPGAAEATVSLGIDNRSVTTIPQWGVSLADDQTTTNTLILGVRRILDELRMPEPVHIELRMNVPASYGLGLSAAVAVSVTRACADVLSLSLTNKEICAISFLSEELVHGYPSGVDNTTICFELPLVFSKGKWCEFTPVVDLPLLVLFSGVTANTHDAIRRIQQRCKVAPASTARLLDEISVITFKGLSALQCGDLKQVGSLLVDNHTVLADLGVSHPLVDSLVLDLLDAGALGAKITGGGCGGAVVALVDSYQTARSLKRRYEKKGWGGFVC
jgi:mevalonate kinase